MTKKVELNSSLLLEELNSSLLLEELNDIIEELNDIDSETVVGGASTSLQAQLGYPLQANVNYNIFAP